MTWATPIGQLMFPYVISLVFSHFNGLNTHHVGDTDFFYSFFLTRNLFLSVLLRRVLLRPILTLTHCVLSDMVGETMIFVTGLSLES